MNTNTEQKTVYILQKDLPYVKAGTRYIKGDGFNGVSDRCSYVPDKMGMMYDRFAIHVDYVENNPEWFLPEQPKEREDVVRNNIPSLTIDEIIDEIRRHCDGTYSIDPQDWDLPRKASEIIEPLKKLAEQVAPKLPPPTPKEETIKVLEIKDGAYLNTDKLRCGKYYTFILNHPFPESKHEPIKKAIEDVLNEGKPKWEWPKERWVGFYDSVNAKVIQLYKSIVDSQSEEIARLRKEILSFIDN